MRKIWIFRVLERNEELGGIKLKEYRMITDSFKTSIGSPDLSVLAEQVKRIKNLRSGNKISLIYLTYRPPFDESFDGKKCSRDYEPLNKEEIKKFRSLLEA